jgi:hypothetical protein
MAFSVVSSHFWNILMSNYPHRSTQVQMFKALKNVLGHGPSLSFAEIDKPLGWTLFPWSEDA